MMMMIIFMMVVMMMIIHKRMLKALSSDWMLNDSSTQREESQRKASSGKEKHAHAIRGNEQIDSERNGEGNFKKRTRKVSPSTRTTDVIEIVRNASPLSAMRVVKPAVSAFCFEPRLSG